MHLLGSDDARLFGFEHRLARGFMNPIKQFSLEDMDQRLSAGLGAVVALQGSRKCVLVELG